MSEISFYKTTNVINIIVPFASLWNTIFVDFCQSANTNSCFLCVSLFFMSYYGDEKSRKQQKPHKYKQNCFYCIWSRSSTFKQYDEMIKTEVLLDNIHFILYIAPNTCCCLLFIHFFLIFYSQSWKDCIETIHELQ